MARAAGAAARKVRSARREWRTIVRDGRQFNRLPVALCEVFDVCHLVSPVSVRDKIFIDTPKVNSLFYSYEIRTNSCSDRYVLGACRRAGQQWVQRLETQSTRRWVRAFLGGWPNVGGAPLFVRTSQWLCGVTAAPSHLPCVRSANLCGANPSVAGHGNRESNRLHEERETGKRGDVSKCQIDGRCGAGDSQERGNCKGCGADRGVYGEIWGRLHDYLPCHYWPIVAPCELGRPVNGNYIANSGVA